MISPKQNNIKIRYPYTHTRALQVPESKGRVGTWTWPACLPARSGKKEAVPLLLLQWWWRHNKLSDLSARYPLQNEQRKSKKIEISLGFFFFCFFTSCFVLIFRRVLLHNFTCVSSSVKRNKLGWIHLLYKKHVSWLSNTSPPLPFKLQFEYFFIRKGGHEEGRQTRRYRSKFSRVVCSHLRIRKVKKKKKTDDPDLKLFSRAFFFLSFSKEWGRRNEKKRRLTTRRNSYTRILYKLVYSLCLVCVYMHLFFSERGVGWWGKKSPVRNIRKGSFLWSSPSTAGVQFGLRPLPTFLFFFFIYFILFFVRKDKN